MAPQRCFAIAPRARLVRRRHGLWRCDTQARVALRGACAKVPCACRGSNRACTAKGSVQSAARPGTSACLAAAARRPERQRPHAHALGGTAKPARCAAPSGLARQAQGAGGAAGVWTYKKHTRAKYARTPRARARARACLRADVTRTGTPSHGSHDANHEHRDTHLASTRTPKP